MNAILEELTRIGPLVERALKKEIDEVVAKAIDETKAKESEVEMVEGDSKEGEEEDGDGESSSESSSESEKADASEVAGEEVGQLVDMLYVSQVMLTIVENCLIIVVESVGAICVLLGG